MGLQSLDLKVIKRAVIDDASSGDNEIVAAVAGKRIYVLSLFLVAGGTTTVRFESGAGGSALTGQMSFIANTGFSAAHNESAWFETAIGESLNLELSDAVTVDGALTYVEV